MATANFHARIERIQKAHAGVAVAAPKSIRASGVAGIAASRRTRRRSPLREHATSIGLGTVLGALAAVAQIGLGSETALWGLNTEWHDLAVYPIMASLAAAPVLLLLSLFFASKKPGLALFSLGYISGLAIPFAL